MRKAIIILLFLACCTSSKEKNYFELSILEKIQRQSAIKPPPAVISFAPVYIININDSICKSTFDKLNVVYRTLYTKEYSRFSDFLFDALNQKIRLDTKNPRTHFFYTSSFLRDPNIAQSYNSGGLETIVKKYCYNNNGFYTLNRETLTVEEVNTISYYFFINQYIRLDDDYKARINFKKLTSVLKT